MDLESFLIWRCAPVIAGVKSANLVSVSKMSFPSAEEQVLRISQEDSPLKFAIICGCAQRVLVFVYREDLLERALCSPAASLWLEQYGYTKNMSVAQKVERLTRRLEKENNCASCEQGRAAFPHEVGVFLGYPLEDVVGFENQNATGFKYSGIWKVYGDKESAIHRMNLYKSCTETCMKWLYDGLSVPSAAKKYKLGGTK